MKHIQLRNGLLVTALMGVMVASSQGQTYNTNEVGTFGITQSDSGAWTFGGANHTFNTANQYSVRFTAMENITLDRVFQRITGLTGGGSLTAELRNDSAGLPGSLITSGSVSPSADIQSVVFGSAAALTSGTVYHVLYKTSTGGGLYRAGATQPGLRPYDRAVDTNLTLLRSDNSGATWTAFANTPYFWFANGSDTAVVAGPGQPYSTFSTPANRNTVQGGGGGKAGQVFTITDKEIPTGKWVAFHKFNLTAQVNATASNNNQQLIARFRDLNNNILASTTITPSQADGTEKQYTLDQQIELQQGVPYVLTFELSSVGENGDFYLLRQQLTDGLTIDESGASWGGNDISFPVRLAFGNTWTAASFVPQNDNFQDQADIVFSFQGIVVPEPSIGLLLFAALLFWRWKR